MSVIVAAMTDGRQIWEKGPCQGFSFKVILVIVNNASGGLLCAAVLKYAGNILRCFSTALSIILTCLASFLIFREFSPDEFFFVGTALAISSVFLYSIDPSSFL